MENIKSEIVKNNIVTNMIALRKAYSFTQGDIAEKISYSDKAVSKWERGESTPDIFVLKQLADLYNIDVDYFLNDHSNETIVKKETTEHIDFKHIMITAIVSASICVFATLLFVIFSILNGEVDKLWLIYVSILPIESILLLIFNMMWGKRKYNIYISSVILWSVLALIYLGLLEHNVWLIFVVGVPIEVVLVLIDKFVRKK